MKISVVYVLPGRQVVREFDLDRETTVAEAIRHSGLPVEFPEIGANTMLVGIYGKVVMRSALLKPGDRVEIYRPLKLDPKAARFKRVRKR